MIWEWTRSRIEEAGRETQDKGQHRRAKYREQKRDLGSLLSPTLFLPLFFLLTPYSSSLWMENHLGT